MNNDQSPSGPETDSPLDRAIDRAVRRMVALDPPPGLGRRVLSRIDRPDTSRWTAFPRLAAGAAVLAMLVLAVLLVPRSPEPLAPVSDAVAPSQPSAAERPAVSKAEPPAVSGVEPPAVSKVERPAVSGVEPPAVSGVEPPAVSKVEPPAVSKVEPSARPPASNSKAPVVSQRESPARAGEKPSTRATAARREPILMPKITNVFGARGAQVTAADAQPRAAEVAPNARDARAPAAPAAPAATPVALVARAAAEARANAMPAPPASTGANVDIELTIIEYGAEGAPVQRTATVRVGDRQNGTIRSGAGSAPALLSGRGDTATFTADTRPTVYADNSVLLSLTLDYLSGGQPSAEADRGRAVVLHDSLRILVASGESIVIAQEADPAGTRRVTVAVKATVVR